MHTRKYPIAVLNNCSSISSAQPGVRCLVFACLITIAQPAQSQQSESEQPKSKQSDSQQSANNIAPYIDQLIDDNIETDSYLNQLEPAETTLSWYNEIELATQWRQNSDDNDAFSRGLSYSAFKNTGNHGNLSSNITATKDDDPLFITPQDNQNEHTVTNFSLRQIDYPINEKMALDTVVGVHRPNISDGSYNNRIQRYLTSRRFRSPISQVYGATTQARLNRTRLSLSVGEFGQSVGTVLPSFEEKDGKYTLLGINHSWKQRFVSAEAWETDDFKAALQNRAGYRFTIDELIGKQWKSSATLAQSDDASSVILNAEQQKAYFIQDFGAYYYEPDYFWLDVKTGNDNSGVYYRFNNDFHPVLFGASAEFQRAGIERKENARDTLLLNGNLGFRINRGNRLNGFYSFRQIQDNDNNTSDASSRQHRLRGILHKTHQNNLNSSYGIGYQHKSNLSDNNSVSQYDLSYSVAKQIQNHDMDIALNYSQENSDRSTINEFDVNLGYSTPLTSAQNITASLGYSTSDAENYRNDGIYGTLTHRWYITNRLSLSSQLSYNDSVTQFDITQDPTALVTDTELDDTEESSFSQYTATMRLTYNFGSNDRSRVIGVYQGKPGSGTVRGRVFIDSNRDGRYQPKEEVLSGIEVFLDSIIPTITNDNGEFVFHNVATGEHRIFIDEGNLPLPLSLEGKEFYPFTIRLRSSEQVNIPILGNY